MRSIILKITVISSILATIIVFTNTIIYAVQSVGEEQVFEDLDSVSYTWYHNIGNNNEISKSGNYSTCDILDIIEPGDLIYERSGGLGVSGHTAIVEEIVEASNGMGWYIQTIEAISDGVVRSVLDCDRLIDRNGTVSRISGVDEENITNVLSYAREQLGKEYDMKYPYMLIPKNCSDYAEKYTCSQLAYCAYKLEGFDLSDKLINVAGVMPANLYKSKLTYDVRVNFYDL